MIKGHCKTNLDDHTCGVVKGFAEIPRIGDFVTCNYKGYSSSLKVVGITHDWIEGGPYIIVELNK